MLDWVDRQVAKRAVRYTLYLVYILGIILSVLDVGDDFYRAVKYGYDVLAAPQFEETEYDFGEVRRCSAHSHGLLISLDCGMKALLPPGVKDIYLSREPGCAIVVDSLLWCVTKEETNFHGDVWIVVGQDKGDANRLVILLASMDLQNTELLPLGTITEPSVPEPSGTNT